ncbi:MAG: radical SAM protein [Myxococcales bacterium]|nr:radical SAM protein [Myxococcales bacterium]
MTKTLTNYDPAEPLRILLMRSGGHFASTDFPDAPMVGPPKSLLYLAGVFADDPGVRVRMLDVLAHPDFEQIARDRENPPFYFGMSEPDVAKRLAAERPHVVGITSTANYYFEDTIRLIALVRAICPDALILLGGPDATNDTARYFERAPALDAIVLREGERTFRHLITALREGRDWSDVRAIVRREGDGLVRTDGEPFAVELDEFRCDYSIADLERYFELARRGYPSRLGIQYPGSHRSIDLVTSRGCVYRCTFCCIYLHMGRRFRVHSVQRVLAEMRALVETHGVRNFHFEDDDLLGDLPRFKEILRGIIEAGWDITWDTPNGVRADRIDEELMNLCRRSGCAYLIFGIESGSARVRDKLIRKDMSLEDVERACRLCFEYEIDSLGYYMFGIPGETQAEMRETYDFAFRLFREYNCTPVFQIWRPYRNTPLEKKVRDTARISAPKIYTVARSHGLPYALFYSLVYQDDEVTLDFLAKHFDDYIRDALKVAILNWLRITSRRPASFLETVASLARIVAGSVRTPIPARTMLQGYLHSVGLTPFAQMRGLGREPLRVVRDRPRAGVKS